MIAGQAYCDGEWREARAVSIPLDDVGFLLGVTVVERLRTFRGRPFQFAQHLARLRRSLEIVGWDADGLCHAASTAIDEFPRRNAPHMAPDDDWTIVAFVTPGTTADASRPALCVHGGPLAFGSWAHQYAQGVHVCLTDVRQTPANCWPPELKCRSRMHYYLADREAARRFPGSRAVLLDQAGFVGEASTANIVCWFADRGLVVPRRGGVLPGISQAYLFGIAQELGLGWQEDDITPQALMAADETFLTSTSVCILPVVRVDNQPIGAGMPGSTYQRLLAAWSDRVGVDIASQARQFATRSRGAEHDREAHNPAK
jgi:branched-subunit amino acid aminotransferase/4-amino-4-deoxychorismate lyase